MNSKLLKLAVAAALALGSLSAKAADNYVSFNFSNVGTDQFNSLYNGLLSGSMTFDTTTNSISSWNFIEGGTSYTATGQSGSSGILSLNPARDNYWLTATTGNPSLYAVGKSESFNLRIYGAAGGEDNFIINAIGQASVAAVPETDTSGMLLMGVGMIGFMARRRKTKQA